MRVNVNELANGALDWAVGYIRCHQVTGGKPIQARDLMTAAMCNGMASPSTDWSEGGPILERECIVLVTTESGQLWDAKRAGVENTYYRGPTPLIAAMRCYVASKLGDEVEVPEDLE
jgi:hypothetical protein